MYAFVRACVCVTWKGVYLSEEEEGSAKCNYFSISHEFVFSKCLLWWQGDKQAFNMAAVSVLHHHAPRYPGNIMQRCYGAWFANIVVPG